MSKKTLNPVLEFAYAFDIRFRIRMYCSFTHIIVLWVKLLRF